MDLDFAAMNFAERGFFLTCLNYAWLNDGIPADPGERARVLKCRRDTADKLWIRVSRKFVESQVRPHFLVNPRAESEKLIASRKSQVCSESAKVGSDRRQNAEPRARDRADSDSDSAFDSNKTSLRIENFAMFLEVCTIAEMQGSETDLKAARSEWGRLDLAQQLAACQGIKDRVAAGELADPGFRPLPQNYLKNKTWQRTIREKHEPAVDKQRAHRNEVVGLMKIIGGLKT